MSCFIILPNQLFENVDLLKGFKDIFLMEEPHYFSGDIKPNKIKIAYMRACMLFYYDYLKENGINVIYKSYDNNYNFLKKFSKIVLYEITDHKLKAKYKSLGLNINEMETPMFLMKLTDLNAYNRDNPTHASFYTMTKEKLGILKDVKNQDVYNRKNPKIDVSVDDTVNYIFADTINYYKNGIAYANDSILFKDHVGFATLETLKIYPITFRDAYKAFQYFLTNNFINFGNFQDVIQETNPFIYHAIISPMLNIGLLNPMKLLKILESYKHKINLSSYEGFVRQIIGWREYMRYLYLYKYDILITSNKHKNYKKLNRSWYTATTGILIIDSEIKKAIKYGYAHHIVRLMVFLNFLILNEINPDDIYKWFMEVISIDAYDWVMVPNIYSMGGFSSIGMKRPYLSSSNYILKMSNYKKNGSWNSLWDDKFRSFVKSRNINFYLRSIK